MVEKAGRRQIQVLFLFLVLVLSATLTFPVEAQESSGSISFQPSEMPNIGFTYNTQEYQFELTWKSYYLNIKPFAIYNGQYYDLKQIIPWLKNNYPNIDYRTAVQKFKNYHRWGFWLEKLPQDVADNLNYLGFDISDNNIPLNTVEIEEVEAENFTFKRIHIANKFTFDFYDLYERGFEVSVNKTTILIGNVKGKVNIDCDPITYGSPTITVIGFTEGDPCTFWDLYNASNVNGWGVVNNTCNTQFKFWCKLQIGDGLETTWFADTNKQVVFVNGTVSGNQQDLIVVKAEASFRLGILTDASNKDSYAGCHIISLESIFNSINIIICDSDDATANLYSCMFTATSIRHYVRQINGRIWHCIFSRYVSPNLNRPLGNIYNIVITHTDYGFLTWTATCEKVFLLNCDRGIYASGATNSTFKDVTLRNSSAVSINTWNLVGNSFFIDCDLDVWNIIWGGTNTGGVYRQYTFNVAVVDKDGNPVENADVTLTYSSQGGGTEYSGSTPENGSIPEQTISKGFYNQTGGDTIYPYEPYNLTIEATGYLTQTFIFNVSEPITWNVPLTETEDGLVIQNSFNIELLILAGLSTIFTIMAWDKEAEKGVVHAALGFFLWFTTSLWWMWQTAGTEKVHFMYIFQLLGTVCLLLTFQKSLEIYNRMGKKGAWI